MHRPIILTTGDSSKDRYILNKRYVSAIEKAGGTMLVIPPQSPIDFDSFFELADGLFLTGGDDIHPRHYKQEIATYYEGTIDEPRYSLQVPLIEKALKRKIPILGICHGLQMLNVYFGGSLYQDIAHELPGAQKHDNPDNLDRGTLSHQVTLLPNTKIAQIVGSYEFMTNSIHHQGVRDLGDGLLASGFTEDGLIESLEHVDHNFVIGVQWHPEELDDEVSQKLFKAFIVACGESI